MIIEVTPLHLATVVLPEGHPRAADGVCDVYGFVVSHPDGTILIDTGPADDHSLINDLYQPNVTPLVTALHSVGVDERDVTAVVNTHLHFDHCGQNRSMPTVPVWVQRAELEAVRLPRFTVPEWAALPDERQRVVDGDEEIAPGVTLLATPGHTPGHQSVLVESLGRRELVVGQACYTCAEFEDGTLDPADLHDDSWWPSGVASLERLRALRPQVARFSHDRHVAIDRPAGGSGRDSSARSRR